MFWSIRVRIAAAYVTLILVLVASLGGYTLSHVRQNYLNDLSTQLGQDALLIADAVGPILSQPGDHTAKMDELSKHWSELLSSRITIVGTDGVVLGESDGNRAEMDNHNTRPEIIEAARTGRGESTRTSRTVGYEMMYVAVRIEEEGNPLGFARVALPLTSIDQSLAHLRNTTLLFALGATALAILLAAWIARRITRPLIEVTDEAIRLATDLPALPSASQARPSLLSRPSDEINRLSFALRNLAQQQRHQIEALRSEQVKLAAVLEQMTDGVIIADAEGIIQLINPTALRLCETNMQDAMGHSLAEALRSHQLVEIWQRSEQSNEIQVAPLELVNRKIVAQTFAIPLTAALPGHVLLIIQDLTRLRQLETIRRDFISNISHELRTPLASLKALTETLQDSALEDPPAARRFLQRMETEVDALSLMVSELLELSRIESGRVPLSFETLTPESFLRSAEERLRLQAERAGLSVDIEIEPDLPSVLADRPRIEQVVVNLLHNAIKFTPTGGKIVLSARRHEDGDFIQFAIQDTGVGIPAAALPRIFERFYKADRARSGGGTGLGLAIARHLVEAHGGKIWVNSQENVGSTFFFTLPINPQHN